VKYAEIEINNGSDTKNLSTDRFNKKHVLRGLIAVSDGV